MLYLFFDVETTGLYDFKAESSAAHQPRIVQLAALLTNDEGYEVASLRTHIKPDGWTVPEEASKIHGFSTEDCEAAGIPMQSALTVFNGMKAAAGARVAHNISFDKVMLAREAVAYGIEHDSGNIESFCTMQMAKPICKIPPTEKMMAAGFKSFKSPNLQEAYRHFFGRDFDNGHDAMEDAKACRDIFFKMKAGQEVPGFLGKKGAEA